MAKRKNKVNIGTKILLAATALLMVWYVGNQVSNISSKKLKSEPALEDTRYDSIRTEGIVFRDEVYVPSTATGIVIYDVADGEEVSKTSSIAHVYQNQQAAKNQDQIETMQKELNNLLKIQEAGTAGITGVSSIGEQINEQVGKIVDIVSTGLIGGIGDEKENLTLLLNKKKVALREENTVSDRIKALETSLNYLRGSVSTKGESVYTPSEGYFYKKIDGYESVFTLEELENLTYERYQELSAEQPLTDVEINKLSQNHLGKIVKSHVWYLTIFLTEKQLEKLSLEDTVKVDFDFANGQLIDAKLIDLIPDADKSNYVGIFECKNVTDKTLGVRKQMVELTFNNYSGLKVSSKALYHEQNIPGVYVLDKTTIRFKPVIVIKDDGTHILCEPGNTDEEHTLKRLDSVIIDSGGIELKDGKQLDEAIVEGVQSINGSS